MQSRALSSARLQQQHQIPCFYHSPNIIQNFCQDAQCLLPMCSVCVGIHAIEHEEAGSFPRFTSLNTVVGQVRNHLESACLKLEQLSQEYTSDYWAKERVQQQCRKQLQMLKVKIMREIDTSFLQIQNRINIQMQRFDDQIHQKYTNLEQEIQYLYESLQLQLGSLQKNDQIIKMIVKFKEEQYNRTIQEWMNKFQNTISMLRKESIKIQVKDNLFDMLSKIGDFVSLQLFTDNGHQILRASSRQLLSSDRSPLGN